MSESSVTRPVAAGNPDPIYSEFEWEQMHDTLVLLLLACPPAFIRTANHDLRQLFTHNGQRLFGDPRKGWLIEDYAEFITQMKTGLYTPTDPQFKDMPGTAARWAGDLASIYSDFEDEFARWLNYTGKASEYKDWRP